jgi:hypothetical protein
MNPKLLLALAFVMSGGLLGCSRTPVYQMSYTPNATFRVVVEPAKTKVHVRESFMVALRVENLTTTNQYVPTESQGWQSQWRVSKTNPSLIYLAATANIPITIKIPPGGADTNEMQMLVNKPVTANKVSFQMGFTPHDTKTTFWSNEVTIEVIP